MSSSSAKLPRQPRSLRDFARLAGVSPATVSRVLSGKGPVASETATRVRELADRLGFHPSAIGQVAFGGSTSSVGVLLPTLTESFFGNIAMGLQEALLEHAHLPVILQRPLLENEYDNRAIRRLLEHRVDAMILHLTEERLTPADFGIVLKAQLPLVLLGSFHAHLDVDTVDNANADAGRQVGRYLVELGHRNVGFAYSGEGQSSTPYRLSGFREALGEAGVVMPESAIAYLPPRGRDIYERFEAELRRVLSSPDRPTAFFACSDLLARKAYAVARELGLHVPRDLSVVGFGDHDYAALLDPPLTTVAQNGKELGRRAAELMLRRLANPEASREHLLVPADLIVRDSTAPPGGA